MRGTFRKNLCIALAAMFLGGFALGGLRVHGEEIDAAPAPGPGAHERILEISRRIQAVLVYPDLARRHGITGVSRVRFEVGTAGRARNIELARSSGHSALDQAARQAVGKASELPWVFGRLEVPVRFSIGNEG